MNMPKIETEEQFLDLAEKFQKDYCLLRDHVVNTQFVDLSDDLYEKFMRYMSTTDI